MNIVEELASLRQKIAEEIKNADSTSTIEEIRHTYLGRKGAIQNYFKQMGKIDASQRGPVGKLLNELKEWVTDEVDSLDRQFEKEVTRSAIDLTLQARSPRLGTLHPLTHIERRICSVFQRMGFSVVRGPEVEDVWHNFDALNTPEWHPSRDPTDTLYLKDGNLLRTETSPVQIRVMKSQAPPVRIVAPGKVYRNDKPDATHSPMFQQVEGLYVDKGVTFADLKGTVLQFYRFMFGKDVKIRFRPHYFPFTEPSAEVDVSCVFCGAKGCRICKGSGWIEMGGSGMVDPNVFESVGYDPEIYTGWAFGLGVERLAMLLYGVEDIRLFYENDFRFLQQFGGRR
ncbi:phenylalanine--tRNA ligase subunit alpha [bacterium]|nr:phenylalanine--tRNA ligase subunit alpha [bacterium]